MSAYALNPGISLLLATKTNDYTWNEPLQNRDDGELERLFNKVDRDGRRYTTNPLHAPGETRNGPTGQPWKGLLPPAGRHWRYAPAVLDDLDAQGLIQWSANGVPRKKIYADDYAKKRVQDIWEFKDAPNPIYPTEKNTDLLDLIIRTSSKPGDLVMDCFCGSGGTLEVAGNLQRRWIGVDSSERAIETTRGRLHKRAELIAPQGFQYITAISAPVVSLDARRLSKKPLAQGEGMVKRAA